MKKYLLWTLILVFLFFLCGFAGAIITSRFGLWHNLSNLIGPENKITTYIKPSDNDWTPFIDNKLPPIIQQGDITSKQIALTFDDGPEGEATDTILNLLKNFHIKATFFLVGSQAEKFPTQAKRIFDEGHELANHTYSHRRLTELRPGAVVDELEKTRTIIFNQTGFIPYLFRPPGGRYTGLTLGIAKDLRYSTVFWTDNSGDWKTMPVNVLAAKVIEHASPGGIILMHNSNQFSTISALPTIIKTLQNQGYRFVTISELMNKKKPDILKAGK